MFIKSQITVRLLDRKLNLTNSLTYTGADTLAAAIANRDVIEVTHLYLRHATVFSDADDPETNFGEKKDLKKITWEDFNVKNGSTGRDILELNSGSSLHSSDSDKYVHNIVKYNLKFSPIDLTDFSPADSSQTDYSNIYYMGLAIRDPQDSGNPEYEDIIFSVLRLNRGEYFGIPSSGQVDLDYKLILDF